MEYINPEKELADNLELISPVKKCPKCGKLSLEFNNEAQKILCSACGFSVELRK